MQIEPLTEAVGADITGVDLSESLDQSTFEKIKAALHNYGVIVFSNQTLDEKQQLAFSSRFGPLEIHIATQYNMPEHPEIILLSNKLVNGQPIGIQEAGRFWHSDLSYMAIPSLGSIINALQMPPPEVGGNTHYAGMHAAYDALGPAMKKKLKGLQAVHDLSYRVGLDEGEGRPRLAINEELRERTTTAHPVVRTHPQTGRKVLFVNEGFTTAIAGWSEDESRDLLDELFAHQSRPEFTYIHKWQAHDIVMWDNVIVIHKATWFDPSYTRHAHRTTVSGVAIN